jgi:hypothetical protein
MNVLGMLLMLSGAISGRRGRSYAPGLLTAGWSWTTATFLRATSDRYQWAALGGRFLSGARELWLAPVLTALAALGLIASLWLVLADANKDA